MFGSVTNPNALPIIKANSGAARIGTASGRGLQDDINVRPIVYQTLADATGDDTLEDLIGIGSVLVVSYATGKGVMNAVYDVVASGSGTVDGVEYHNSATANLFQLKLRIPDRVSLRVAGCGLDGADDTVALQRAVSSAIPNWTGNGLTCRFDSTVSGTVANFSSKSFSDTKFDFSNNAVASDIAIDIRGTLGSFVVPNAIVAGDSTVVVPSTVGYSKGQWLLFKSADSFAGDGTTMGEWNQVKEVTNATTLTFYRKFHLSYTTLPKMYAPSLIESFVLTDCEFVGAGDAYDQTCVYAEYCKVVNASNFVGDLFGNRYFDVRSNVAMIATNPIFRNANYLTGLAYGIAIANTHNTCVITNPTGSNVRHIVATGGTDGVNFHLSVIGGAGDALTEAAIDNHAASMYTNIQGGTYSFKPSSSAVNGDGIVLQSYGATVNGVTLIGCGRHGVTWEPQSTVDGDWLSATNMTVREHGGNTASTAAGVLVSPNKPSGDIKSIKVSGDITSSESTSAGFALTSGVAGANIEQINVDMTSKTVTRGVQTFAGAGYTVNRMNVRGAYEVTSAVEVMKFDAFALDDIKQVNINTDALVGGTIAVSKGVNVKSVQGHSVEVSGQSSVKFSGCFLTDSDQSAQEIIGSGAISVERKRTYITTTAGAAALTLGAGHDGQRKSIYMQTDGGGTATLTPSLLHNGSTITFNDIGDCAELEFMDGGWVFLGGSATLV